MEFRRQEVALGFALLLLLAVAIVRTVMVPDRARLRPVSVEGVEIPTEPIAQGQRIERQKSWSPPAEIYLLGWNYRIGAGASGIDLVLLVNDVSIFHVRTGDVGGANPAFLPGGAGYRVRPVDKVRLLYVVTNTGPPGDTRGAGALIYFVPVEGN
jgi:hypothetical protein